MSKVTRMDSYQGDEFGLASPVFAHDVKGHEPATGSTEKGLEVLVIFTDPPGTLAALQMAGALAQKLDAHIRLVLPFEVPYALPLTQPMVPVDFLEDQIRDLACKSKLDVEAQIYLCRDKRRALHRLLRPQSLIVVGGRKRWWPTGAERLARGIQKDGHHLIFAELR